MSQKKWGKANKKIRSFFSKKKKKKKKIFSFCATPKAAPSSPPTTLCVEGQNTAHIKKKPMYVLSPRMARSGG
jgi:hypothetical protein